jgi:hypothetical protein
MDDFTHGRYPKRYPKLQLGISYPKLALVCLQQSLVACARVLRPCPDLVLEALVGHHDIGLVGKL